MSCPYKSLSWRRISYTYIHISYPNILYTRLPYTSPTSLSIRTAANRSLDDCIPPLLTNHFSSSGSTAILPRVSPTGPQSSPAVFHRHRVIHRSLSLFFYLTPANTQHRPLLDFDRFIHSLVSTKIPRCRQLVNCPPVTSLSVCLFNHPNSKTHQNRPKSCQSLRSNRSIAICDTTLQVAENVGPLI